MESLVGDPMLAWGSSFDRGSGANPDHAVNRLVFCGMNGDVLQAAYQESRPVVVPQYNAVWGTIPTVQNIRAPAFDLNLQYDLSTLKDIRFRDFQLRVIEATPSNVRFMVIGDAFGDGRRRVFVRR